MTDVGSQAEQTNSNTAGHIRKTNLDSYSKADKKHDHEKDSEKDEKRMFEIEGRKGLYIETETLCDKYDARPDGVEMLTLSQFATSYTKCAKPPKGLNFS